MNNESSLVMTRTLFAHLISDFVLDLVFLLLGRLIPSADVDSPRFQLSGGKPSPPAPVTRRNIAIEEKIRSNNNKTKTKWVVSRTRAVFHLAAACLSVELSPSSPADGLVYFVKCYPSRDTQF
jgi:hypothetical protein